MKRFVLLLGCLALVGGCVPENDAGEDIDPADSGDTWDAAENPGEDAGRAADAGSGLAPPESEACCSSCAPGSSCQPNGCFNGYFCDRSRCRCVPPPQDGGVADAGTRDAGAPDAGPGCEHACAIPGETRCENRGGYPPHAWLWTCSTWSNGCRGWDGPITCGSGFCADEATCGVCHNACSYKGERSCSGGVARACVADDRGCLSWSEEVCASGFCSGTACGSCNHLCDVAGTVECDGGETRACQADVNGCRKWTAPTACASGFCADAVTCGVCHSSCGAECLWKADSCMEVVHRETQKIGELSATSEGLFWNRDHGGAGSALVHLPFAGGEVQSLGTLADASMELRAKDDVLYAKAWKEYDDSRFFIKAPGAALLAPRSSTGLALLFAGSGAAFFSEGISIYTPYRHIFRRSLPTACTEESCALGPQETFYSGDQEWPGSSIGDGDGTSLYFVSQRYGNFPINDVKRTASRIFKAPLGGGPATLVKQFSDKYGPLALTIVSGRLYYLLDGTIDSIDLATGVEKRLYRAPGYTKPYRFVTDGQDVFWIDSASQLVRLRQGATKPEILTTGMDIGIPYNLALTDDAVYVTGDGRKTVLRWSRY